MGDEFDKWIFESAFSASSAAELSFRDLRSRHFACVSLIMLLFLL